MKIASFFLALTMLIVAGLAEAAPRVMNPGEAIGQLIYLSENDVKAETEKYKSLSPLSIPVWAELPLDMSVVAGAITLKQQTLLSHVQLKSRARGTPNLDISEVPAGMNDPIFKGVKEGQWVRLVLTKDGGILIESSTEQAALAFYNRKKSEVINLKSDVTETRIRSSREMSSADFITVGSKSANYAELANFINTADRTVVRPGYGIPFAYSEEFVQSNPKIKAMVAKILRDPLMNRVAKVSYREAQLKALRDLMTSEESVVSDKLVDELISIFDQQRDSKGKLRKMKLRSSTNSEDLPNFNGAGLYSSFSYKPLKKDVEKSPEEKRKHLKDVLRKVWASVWNLRAFDERSYFQIPHAQVKMGIQVNPSFEDEGADGVVVSKNIADIKELAGPGVYIEVQRGSKYSVTNPVAGIKPQKILVRYEEPLDLANYQVHILQNSNIADDGESILPQDNPIPVMTNEQIKDLALQVMKAHLHFKPKLGAQNPNFSLDLEFKVDSEDTGSPQVYLKQARPYID